MKLVSLNIPSLAKVKDPVPIVTDDEVGICQAIDKFLPGVHRLRCWNHLINAAKAWLRSHITTPEKDDIPVYVSHLRQLFHQESEDLYTNKLQEYSADWSKAFYDYYFENIHENVSCTHYIAYVFNILYT